MGAESVLSPLAQLVYHKATPKVILIDRLTLFSFNVLTTIMTNKCITISHVNFHNGTMRIFIDETGVKCLLNKTRIQLLFNRD